MCTKSGQSSLTTPIGELWKSDFLKHRLKIKTVSEFKYEFRDCFCVLRRSLRQGGDYKYEKVDKEVTKLYNEENRNLNYDEFLKEAFCGYPCGTDELYGNFDASFLRRRQ